jgi:uncharacterized protein HemX
MARNRKYHSASNRFGPALKAFLICLLLGGSAVGYVWQKNQISLLGHDIKLRETNLHLLVEQNRRLDQQLQNLKKPGSLKDQLQSLGLVLPPQSQVWSLPEPARETPKPATVRQFVPKDEQIAKMP